MCVVGQVIEEQLRRAAFLKLDMNNSSQNVVVVDPMTGATGSVLSLNSRFSELETLADSHYHLSTQSANGNKPANDVLKRVLVQLEEILNDMKHEVNRIPASLTRLPGVCMRLQMREMDILNKLAMSANATQDELKRSDPYAKFNQYIGGFQPNIASNVAWMSQKDKLAAEAAKKEKVGSARSISFGELHQLHFGPKILKNSFPHCHLFNVLSILNAGGAAEEGSQDRRGQEVERRRRKASQVECDRKPSF